MKNPVYGGGSIVLILAAWIATATVPALAGDIKSTPAPYSAPPASNATRVVCTKERVTGSMIPVKRCRTVQQLRDEQKASSDYLRSLNDAQTGRITSDKPGMGPANQ